MFLLAALCGCGSVDSPDKLQGYYELTSGDIKISLNVRGDHSYTEIVTYTKGGEESSTNRWDWVVTGIVFHDLLLPEIDGIRPERFFGSETPERLHHHKTARGTDQLDWSLAGERLFGRTRLVPYPDADIFFYMATHE